MLVGQLICVALGFAGGWIGAKLENRHRPCFACKRGDHTYSTYTGACMCQYCDCNAGRIKT